MNAQLLKTSVRFWLMEILVSSFNFFVLMNLVYEPKWGEIAAHQIGISTRIVCIFVFAYFLLSSVRQYDTKDLIHGGVLWLGLTLLFEWGGGLAIGRPVGEILVGWNILSGYMWPYVLMAYLLSNLIVGKTLHLYKKRVEMKVKIRKRSAGNIPTGRAFIHSSLIQEGLPLSLMILNSEIINDTLFPSVKT